MSSEVEDAEGRTDLSRSVVVTGSGSAVGVPDVVRLHVSANAVRPSAGEAVEATDQCVLRVREALASSAPAGTTAESADLSLATDESWDVDPRTGRNTRSRNGFRAGHGLLVRIGSRDALSSVLGAVLGAGGDELAVNHVEFAVSDPSVLRDRARVAAWEDARHRASAHAAEAAGRLGRVLEILEDAQGGHRPMPAMRAMSAEAGSTLEPGSVQVTVEVTVRWDLL